MITIYGAMLTLYHESVLQTTGYYLSDIRTEIVTTHPFIAVGILLVAFGSSFVLSGLGDACTS